MLLVIYHQSYSKNAHKLYWRIGVLNCILVQSNAIMIIYATIHLKGFLSTCSPTTFTDGDMATFTMGMWCWRREIFENTRMKRQVAATMLLMIIHNIRARGSLLYIRLYAFKFILCLSFWGNFSMINSIFIIQWRASCSEIQNFPYAKTLNSM